MIAIAILTGALLGAGQAAAIDFIARTVVVGTLGDVSEDGWLRLRGKEGAQDTVYALDIATADKPLWRRVRVLVDDRRTLRGDALVELGPGDDRAILGDGVDWAKMGCGDDVALGGAGPDHLYGGCGRDLLRGQKGADFLDGGYGEDVLRGGEGSDWLVGAWDGAVDVLVGGAGADVFVVDPKDRVLDFDRGVDLLIEIE